MLSTWRHFSVIRTKAPRPSLFWGSPHSTGILRASKNTSCNFGSPSSAVLRNFIPLIFFSAFVVTISLVRYIGSETSSSTIRGNESFDFCIYRRIARTLRYFGDSDQQCAVQIQELFKLSRITIEQFVLRDRPLFRARVPLVLLSEAVVAAGNSDEVNTRRHSSKARLSP